MRRALAFILAACVVAGGVFLAVSGHAPRRPHVAVKAAHTRVVTNCASAGCEAYAATLQWSGVGESGRTTTGYNVFLDGARVGSTRQQSWTFTGMDCGTTFQLAVQADDSGSDVSPKETTSYTTPACAPIHVGAPTPAGVTCTQTLDAGADVGRALSSASPGAVVCLNPGAWPAITLTGIAPEPPGVTLAAAPGQTVVVPGFTLLGSNTQNLTIEGFSITRPGNGNSSGFQLLCGISGGVTIKYNTIEDQPKGYGIYAYAQNCGPGHTQTGVWVEYNQIDHVGSGIQINGNHAEQRKWTISHNVIGPHIQDGGYGHYIEIGGVAGATINNNAFEGPPDPAFENPTSHLNVLHIDNGKSDVTFANNIMWHVKARAQTVLIQDTPMDNIDIENNLDVEDPACETDSNCYTSPLTVYAAHGLRFSHNTYVNGAWSVSLAQTGLGYSDPHDMTAQYNIVAPASALGSTTQPNYSDWTCTSSCVTDHNVSGDGSANSALGGTDNVANWTPSWTTTSWTPVSGSGYKPPPHGYYQPEGLDISGAGYQGHIGP
jgi:hypothetical protein